MSTRLQKVYNEEIKNSLKEKMNYKSSMEVPHIVKITINVGLGEAVKDKKSYWTSYWRYRENFWPKTYSHKS